MKIRLFSYAASRRPSLELYLRQVMLSSLCIYFLALGFLWTDCLALPLLQPSFQPVYFCLAILCHLPAQSLA